MSGRILFAWQLGGGLGHLLRIAPLAAEFSRRGVRVDVVLRHLERAADVFGVGRVGFFQAPAKGEGRAMCSKPVTFAQLLGNTGFGDPNELMGLASAWRDLLETLDPDLVVCDHSPLALLAARASARRAVVLGTGFSCPPDQYPMPPVRAHPATEQEAARSLADEDVVLANVNWVLSRWGRPALDRLGQLYGAADDRVIATFPELDHYGDRGAGYYGPVTGGSQGGSCATRWPDGTGRSVFAYIKYFPAFDDLMGSLRDAGLRVLIVPDKVPDEVRRRWDGGLIRFAPGRVDVSSALRACDIAVLNGTHGTTCDAVLAGRPTLHFPLWGEQALLAAAVGRAGIGRTIIPGPGVRAHIDQAIQALIHDPSYLSAASALGARYAGVDAGQRVEAICNRLCAVLARPIGHSAIEPLTARVRAPAVFSKSPFAVHDE